MISLRDTVNDRRIIAMFCDFRVSRMKTCEGGPDFFSGFGVGEVVGSPRGDFLLAAMVPNRAPIRSPLNLNLLLHCIVLSMFVYNCMCIRYKSSKKIENLPERTFVPRGGVFYICVDFIAMQWLMFDI